MDERLHLLGPASIDMLMIHEPDRPGQDNWWADPVEYHGPVLEVRAELKWDCCIHFTGLSGTTAYILAALTRTGWFDVVLACLGYQRHSA